MPVNNNSGYRIWSDDMDETIRKGVLSGASYAAIAAKVNDQFGTNYTRNAIIGRASRLGLSGNRRPASARQHGVRERREPGATTGRVKGQSLGPVVAKIKTKAIVRAPGDGFKKIELIEPMLDLPNLWCEPVDLLELKEHMCRWPMDGGKFCGLNKTTPEYGETSYCKAHHRQSVVPNSAYRKPLIHRRV